MSGSAFWSQGGFLEGVARELPLGGGTGMPQRREKERVPGCGA